MDDHTGYLETRQSEPGRYAWKDYTAFCSLHDLPRVCVAKATYWKVTVDAGTLSGGRFTPYELAWLTDLADAYSAYGESSQRRFKALPVRVTTYGLTLEAARRLASQVVAQFPALTRYEPIPPGTRTRKPAPAPRASSSGHGQGSFPPSNVVSLAMKRKQKYPTDTDLFGMPRKRTGRFNPTDRGPA